jgi:hypothetical protein
LDTNSRRLYFSLIRTRLDVTICADAVMVGICEVIE